MPDGAVLEAGAGTGRVTLELAGTGRRVIAVDRDGELLGALRRRAGNLDVQTLCADARSFTLPAGTPRGAPPAATQPAGALPSSEQVALCLVPMQTIQLLGGAEGRLAFLRRARAHLCPGGLCACSVVTELEPFDCAGGAPGPSPETAWVDGVRYCSRATRVELGRQTIAIERERTTSASQTVERDLIELDRLTVAQLEREGAAVGLHAEPARHVAPTADHSGSSVVMLRV